MKLWIPPPLYAFIFLLAMWFLAKFLPIIQWHSPLFSIFSAIFLILGLVMDISSVIRFFIDKTSVNPFRPNNSSKLVTSGFYAYTRNPMYLGLLFILLASACYLRCLSAFLVLPVFMWVLTIMQIKPEEAILEEKFKDAYLQYKKKVRRWL